MKILVTIPVNEKQKQVLEEASQGATFIYQKAADLTASELGEIEVVVGQLLTEQPAQMPALKLLQTDSAGVDRYLAPGVLPDQVILANATGAYGKSVSEHMFAMLMTLQKKLELYRDQQFRGAWNDLGEVMTLSRSRVAVVGIGDIGKRFAGFCKAFGGAVIGVRKDKSKSVPEVDGIYDMEEFMEKRGEFDVIISFLPHTTETIGIYNREFFKGLKKTAIFMNGGRGTAVVQDDLLAALKAGEFGQAALDVTTPEPLPADHPLWQEARVLLTPHVSGQFHLPETLDIITEIAAANIRSFQKGDKLKNQIDRSKGYA